MGRPGRPRQPARPRTPSGAPSRAKGARPYVDPTAVCKAQRLARGATEANWTDQMHATPLGRLCITGQLGAPDVAKDLYETGVWYRRLWLRASGVMQAPSPYPRSEARGGGGERDHVAELRAMSAYNDAMQAIRGSASKAAVWRIICCEQETTHAYDIAPLIEALRAMGVVRLSGRVAPSEPRAGLRLR